MTGEPCEICRGMKTVRLPIYRRITAWTGQETETSPERGYREFPCPACGESVAVDQLYIVRQDCLIDAARRGEEAFTRMAMQETADQLARSLMESGYIVYTISPENPFHMSRKVMATVAVAAPEKTRSLATQIEAASEGLAREVADEAKSRVCVWGSHYHGREGGVIDKSIALQFIDEALKEVLKRRAQTKEMQTVERNTP